MSEPDIYTIKLADNEPEQFVKHTDYMKLHYSWKEMFADGIQVLRQERDEMAKLKADNERLTENIEKLCKHGDLEIERLRAEVERLQHLANQSEFYRSQLQKDTCRLDNIQMQDAFKHYEAENARLKAEVERLTERNKFLEQIDSYLQGANENAYEKRCDELEAEVERLRKAGDWMCGLLRFDFVTKEWNAAKEGKQS